MVLLAGVAFSFTGPAAGEGIAVTVEPMEEGRSLMVCLAPGITEGGLALAEGSGIGASPWPECGGRAIFTVCALSVSSEPESLIVCAEGDGVTAGAACGVSLTGETVFACGVSLTGATVCD